MAKSAILAVALTSGEVPADRCVTVCLLLAVAPSTRAIICMICFVVARLALVFASRNARFRCVIAK